MTCFVGRLLAALIFLLATTAFADSQFVQLRNERIETKEKAQRPAAKSASQPHSGLFLLQFEGPLQADWTAVLKRRGVNLIRYVPDHAFIARGEKVRFDDLEQLPFVRWAGPFRPDHKIHGGLKGKLGPAGDVAVSILLAPDASPLQLASARGLLKNLVSESTSRFGHVWRGQIDRAQVNKLAESEATLWIEPAAKRKLYDEFASKIVGGDDGALATPTVTQQLGFDGSGVTVCVADTGLDTGDMDTMHPDLFGRVTGFQFYGANITDASDGYGHGTHCAGIVAGNAATGETDPDDGGLYGLGIAPAASLFIERIFDDYGGEASPFPTDETLTRDAVRHGAKIGSNSWGNDTQGEYDLDCMQFDALVRDADAGTPGDQPYVLEFSAGNAGPASQTIGSPACAKNVIATGASENVPGILAQTYGLYADGPDAMADFSSRGPCADGRIKPDLVAPGTWIASAASSYALDLAGTTWTVIDDYYVYEGGTSMSGPYAAGAAAVFMQFYQSTHSDAVPSPALVKAALINSASELDQTSGGPGPVPNNEEGWGRVALTNIITTNVAGAPRYYEYVDQSVLLTNSQVYSQHIFVQGAEEPLKITLAYTDVPGFPGAIPALVNDLDLEVVAPDGTLYRGNQFGAGESVPNAPTPDRLNNVEGIYLSHPVSGDYLVLVRGSRIVQDSIVATPGVVDQDFALVSSGNLVRPGTGFVLLDRTSYTAPGIMEIAVFDAARAANNSLNVLVTNLTAHTSVTKTLNTAGNYGAFIGAVATVTGAAGAGQMQIADGDNLEVVYFDAGGIKRTASAVADLRSPNISAVASTTDVGVLTITWQTDEPSTSIVFYGTNSSNLNLGVTNLAIVTDHVVKLTGLIPGRPYYYFIVATDGAGNSATANNGGSFYTFNGVETPIVLLVDDFDTAWEEANGGIVIPDSAYTNVLAAAGISFGFWKVNVRGGPQLADLKPFPIVIWRTTDDAIYYGYDEFGVADPTATNNTLNAQQQFMIQSYLNGGGSFFMASMEILSHLGNAPFRRNVLQVAGFEQNTSLIGICPNCDEDRGVPAFSGAPSSIAAGFHETLDYSNYPSFDLGLGDPGETYGPDFSDTFTPPSDATAIAFELVSGKPCAVSYPNIGVDSPGRVVFFSLPFDAIPTNDAVTLLRNIVNFLAPGVNGVGVISLDNTVYSTNDALVVEVGDSDLAGAGQALVNFVATDGSRSNQTTVTLQETTHPGLFRGSLTLVSGVATNGQLSVLNGDAITATYADVSNGSNVVASAVVDTVPPGIANVAATTDFYNARVTWQTSKPSDSAVQYGNLNQPPVNTVYDAALVTNHSVTIIGLLPNRVYDYQVASRDQAGNTTVDDNGGNYYTFTTLRGLAPPWTDDFETGAPGWSVVGGDSTEVNWALGTPDNTLATSAHSGINAWGINLKHQMFTFAESYLYSPPIDLSGMSQVTLKFWGNYNLTSGFEYGELGVSTNSASPPSSIPSLASYSTFASAGWVEETVDLSQFAGQTVQVVWYYGGISLFDILDGWLVDDVSITGVMAGGNISVTKNLGQGSWSVSSISPIGLVPVQSGGAPSITITNLPLGNYVVQFGDVPFYLTPSAQTNTLVDHGQLNFSGNYTLIDTNQNGMADSWEKTYFGAASATRTEFTDTDGDGMTDYAEFLAGTNPTNSASVLRLFTPSVQNAGAVRFDWPAFPGRSYRLTSSTNLSAWEPATDWIQAGGNMLSLTTNVVSGARFRFYRVEVRP